MMTRIPQWVLDTNVVVSGLLSPHGPPGRLIDAVLARALLLVVDDRILHEYREVLSRPRFKIDSKMLKRFLAIMDFQIHCSTAIVKGLYTTDPDDLAFLEVAAMTTDKILVTGNSRHYPVAGRGSVLVLSPVDAVGKLWSAD